MRGKETEQKEPVKQQQTARKKGPCPDKREIQKKVKAKGGKKGEVVVVSVIRSDSFHWDKFHPETQKISQSGKLISYLSCPAKLYIQSARNAHKSPLLSL